MIRYVRLVSLRIDCHCCLTAGRPCHHAPGYQVPPAVLLQLFRRESATPITAAWVLHAQEKREQTMEEEAKLNNVAEK